MRLFLPGSLYEGVNSWAEIVVRWQTALTGIGKDSFCNSAQHMRSKVGILMVPSNTWRNQLISSIV